MKLLDVNKLLPGDIVLTTTDAKVSRAIRRLTGSPYSHAMLYVASSSIIHSNLDGVHAENTQRMPFGDDHEPLVLRLRDRQPGDIQKICVYARAQVGVQYSVAEAARSAASRRDASALRTNRQFCSRLVAEAYAYCGYRLVPNPHYCFPSDLQNDALLATLTHPLRVATQADRAVIDLPNPLEVQKKITNFMFAEFRRLSGEDLQTHEQLAECLCRRPALDAEFSAVLLASGHLDFWKFDVKANPWRYDAQARRQARISKEQQEWERNNADDDIRRFAVTASQYEALHRATGLRYFLLERDLYRHLVEIHSTRRQLASGA